MLLKDCILDVDHVVMAPFIRNEPHQLWVESHKSGVIPDSVFTLYNLAGFLSFGSAPQYLKDRDNILFSYFSIIMESVRDSLEEAERHINIFTESVSRTCDQFKMRVEEWDPIPGENAKREFRYFLLSEFAALDAVADLTAILLTGLVPKLLVGRAQFIRIERWLKEPLPVANIVLPPQENFSRQLYNELRPLVYPDSRERDWLPLMRLYRNKGAHLESSVFRLVYLHDDSGSFYIFFPRQWPFIWEQYFKPAGQPYNGPTPLELLSETLIHQDAISWVKGLNDKVKQVVEASFSVLKSAYKHLSELPINQAALKELQANSEKYEFEQFEGHHT